MIERLHPDRLHRRHHVLVAREHDQRRDRVLTRPEGETTRRAEEVEYEVDDSHVDTQHQDWSALVRRQACELRPQLGLDVRLRAVLDVIFKF